MAPQSIANIFFLSNEDPEWDKAWGTFPDPTLYNEEYGETIQYMGTVLALRMDMSMSFDTAPCLSPTNANTGKSQQRLDGSRVISSWQHTWHGWRQGKGKGHYEHHIDA